MKIAISGSRGFIGNHLSEFLSSKGYSIVPLKHTDFKNQASEEILTEILKDCDIVINLAGATINQRWTASAKRRIMDSRVDTTRLLVSVINKMQVKPSLFISASAVGVYPSEGVYNENSTAEGTSFLSEVCHYWEGEAQKLSPDVRLVVSRFGVVLSNDGGALPMMLLPFRFFIGGKIGSGRQGFSWIHIDDVLQAMWFIIQHPELSGTIDLVSPQPITNEEFAVAAAYALHRPSWLPIPSFVFYLLYGEGQIIITEGQQAYPVKLLSAGYVFRYSDIRVALQSLTV